MRTRAELEAHLTELAMDEYGQTLMRPTMLTLTQAIVAQMLDAAQLRWAASQIDTTQLLVALSQLVADTCSDEGVHECAECGCLGLEDEMHDHSTTYTDRWLCDDCLTGGLDECDAVRDRELEGVVA